jgi:hypothetical protein
VATETLSLVVERSGRKAEHPPPPGAEVKNEPGYTSILPARLHGLYRIKSDLLTKCSARSGSRGVRLKATDFKGTESFTQPFTCVALMKREREWNSQPVTVI